MLETLADALRSTLSSIARKRDLMFEFSILSTVAPVKCAGQVIEAIDESVDALELDAVHMHSGAAHDTQIMSTITRAGMIFVPSKEGRSHSSAEWTAWEDIEAGANVLLNTLWRLAS